MRGNLLWRELTADLDYSAVLIEKMQQRVPELDWRVMDIRELSEHADELGGPGTWDVIIDKGRDVGADVRHDGCPHGGEWIRVEPKRASVEQCGARSGWRDAVRGIELTQSLKTCYGTVSLLHLWPAPLPTPAHAARRLDH